MSDFAPVLSSLVTALFGIILWYMKDRGRKRELTKGEMRSMKMAILSMLRNKIVEKHSETVERWSITTAELQSFREMHQIYVDMGGNGPASHLLDDVERVKLVHSHS